jgi:GNAT superfamily N-acetyltransferase
MPDARVAAVEDNLEHFLRTVSQAPMLERGPDDDVVCWWSGHPDPILNAITAARFGVGDVERRAREVVGPYLDRGLPFMWWSAPSGHAVELAPVLTGLGLVHLEVPGMYVEMRSPIRPRLDDRAVVRQVAGVADLHESCAVMLEGFEIPSEVHEPYLDLITLLDGDALVQVTAWWEGDPVGCGTAWISGDTAGLYNITTLERARRRGIGRAVTATLMDAALARGARRAILHASDAGLAVYRRLGFETVCQVPQFLWLPE